MEPGVLLQQLALLQQQVSYMGASLEGKFGALESSLESKIENLETRLGTVQNRLENKIETRVVDKLCQLELKLPDTEDDRHVNAQILDEIINGLKSYKEQKKMIVKGRSDRII